MCPDGNHKKLNKHSNSCPHCGLCSCCCVIKCSPGKQGKQGPPGKQGLPGRQGATGLQGLAGATGATGTTGAVVATGATGSSGANTGFQRIAGSPGATSQTIPYVTGGAGTYNFQVCSNVNNNASAPTSSEIIATIELTVTATTTGTFKFSIRSTDVGAQPVFVSNGGPYGIVSATVTWSSNVVGNPLAFRDAISLYSNPTPATSAVYTIFLNTGI